MQQPSKDHIVDYVNSKKELLKELIKYSVQQSAESNEGQDELSDGDAECKSETGRSISRASGEVDSLDLNNDESINQFFSLLSSTQKNVLLQKLQSAINPETILGGIFCAHRNLLGGLFGHHTRTVGIIRKMILKLNGKALLSGIKEIELSVV